MLGDHICDGLHAMNVTVFRLANPLCVSDGDPIFGAQRAIYTIPTLPAYALIDSSLMLDGNPYLDAINNSVAYSIHGNRVEIPNRHGDLFGPPTGMLTIYHNGIKDFELLFPHVNDDSLRNRIACFAEEASNAFESQSWISYCLMVGGVLEGLLFNQFGQATFSDLIKKALKTNLISAEEAALINNVRTARNKIHASMHGEKIADRKVALELSTAYERLIKRNWIASND